jgi:hippurate hydrolase
MSDLADLTVGLRRRIHAQPETGLDNPTTQELVLTELQQLPYEVTTGDGCTSVTAVLRSGRPGRTVLLRADTDALPVPEQTGLAFAAQNGSMHACGHDLHTAMLLGAAHLLADRRDRLTGDVILAFQPGEEGYDGAGVMLREGLLDAAGSRPDAAFALHVTSTSFPSGLVTARPGPAMAAADKLVVTVHGQGGHGSAPQHARDPLLAAAGMVAALQQAVTREFDVFDPVVVTVGQIQGGVAHNVISDSASFEATVRSFSLGAQERLQQVLPRVCRGLAMAHGVEVEVDYTVLFPPTVNDEHEALWALDLARDLIGPDKVQQMKNPLTGSEDFSRVLQEVPGAMLFVGATPPGLDPSSAPYNHAPDADFDEAVLPLGAELYAALAEQALARA